MHGLIIAHIFTRDERVYIVYIMPDHIVGMYVHICSDFAADWNTGIAHARKKNMLIYDNYNDV